MAEAGIEALSAAPDDVDLVSVVVCTRGRRPSLWQLLESLSQLRDPHYEVIVVENSRAAALDERRVASSGARLVLERRLGLDAARNRGAIEARGSIVAYVDDDCVVDPGWLGGIRSAFEDTAVALVAGRVLPSTLDLPSQRLFQRWCSWDRGPERIRLTIDDRLPGFPESAHHLGTGCNMAFRRGVLEEIGGFDEALDMGTLIGGGGDLDAFVRVLDARHVTVYEPTALVLHTHRATIEDLRWQIWGYGIAQGAVLAKGAWTRPELRRGIARAYRSRLGTKRRQLQGRQRSGLPRRLVAIEAAGIAAGPLVYPPSWVLAWLRRRRR